MRVHVKLELQLKTPLELSNTLCPCIGYYFVHATLCVCIPFACEASCIARAHVHANIHAHTCVQALVCAQHHEDDRTREHTTSLARTLVCTQHHVEGGKQLCHQHRPLLVLAVHHPAKLRTSHRVHKSLKENWSNAFMRQYVRARVPKCACTCAGARAFA